MAHQGEEADLPMELHFRQTHGLLQVMARLVVEVEDLPGVIQTVLLLGRRRMIQRSRRSVGKTSSALTSSTESCENSPTGATA